MKIDIYPLQFDPILKERIWGGEKLNLELKAKRDRKYPELKIGDEVKITLKYNKMKKEHDPSYSDMKYKIEKILRKALATNAFVRII